MFGPTELILILLLIVPVFLILPLIAIVDLLRSRFAGNDGLVFVLIILFLPVLGAIIYFIMSPSRKLR
ncbi:MAG: hypothetical protein FJY11_06565 [Bacteroidetes bacterium]|nr:hypothetical protein [Bacteroidota bacterium]